MAEGDHDKPDEGTQPENGGGNSTPEAPTSAAPEATPPQSAPAEPATSAPEPTKAPEPTPATDAPGPPTDAPSAPTSFTPGAPEAPAPDPVSPEAPAATPPPAARPANLMPGIPLAPKKPAKAPRPANLVPGVPLAAGSEPEAEESEAPASGAPEEPKRWYIVHTYSGHEARAKRNLLERAKSHHMSEMFDEILIPEENVVEVVKGEKRTSKRKFFPGYILVRMSLTDESWHVVRNTPKITGFVGGASKPSPIDDSEVARMTQQIKEGAAKPKPKIRFEEGENVRVVSGPFANFSGFVDEVKPEKEKVRVMVQVFGRATPVELDYMQVEKA